jgi:hypothetical protein
VDHGSVELVDGLRGYWKESKILSEPETSIKERSCNVGLLNKELDG